MLKLQVTKGLIHNKGTFWKNLLQIISERCCTTYNKRASTFFKIYCIKNVNQCKSISTDFLLLGGLTCLMWNNKKRQAMHFLANCIIGSCTGNPDWTLPDSVRKNEANGQRRVALNKSLINCHPVCYPTKVHALTSTQKN